jgi:hypothetical protein
MIELIVRDFLESLADVAPFVVVFIVIVWLIAR